MKKIHKLTSFLTAATMALSMSVSFSAAAVMQPEEGKKHMQIYRLVQELSGLTMRF
ncbi:MAG TPA: hypothetical protein P5191_04945 [Ruminococcus sp.]|nr:hypothetical protein [Ruminococcus sp.]